MRRSAARAEATIPEDLRAAIEANPRARKTFRTLGRQNLFALAFRTNNMKTPAGRAKKIAALVAMLARGETIVPQRGRRGAVTTSRRVNSCIVSVAASNDIGFFWKYDSFAMWQATAAWWPKTASWTTGCRVFTAWKNFQR